MTALNSGKPGHFHRTGSADPLKPVLQALGDSPVGAATVDDTGAARTFLGEQVEVIVEQSISRAASSTVQGAIANDLRRMTRRSSGERGK